MQDFRVKATQWSSLQHMNIVKVFGLGENLDLKVEFCENGTARQYLEKHDFNSQKKQKIIQDIMQGVAYLHAQDPPIVHGSLQLGKIFVSEDGTARVGEFGLSILTSGFAMFAPAVSVAGLSRWMAPELIDIEAEDWKSHVTIASDTWALGCTLLELVSGDTPYKEIKRELGVRRAIIQGKKPGSIPLEGGEFRDTWNFMVKCWQAAPSDRPILPKILAALRPPSPSSSLISSAPPDSGLNPLGSLPNYEHGRPHRNTFDPLEHGFSGSGPPHMSREHPPPLRRQIYTSLPEGTQIYRQQPTLGVDLFAAKNPTHEPSSTGPDPAQSAWQLFPALPGPASTFVSGGGTSGGESSTGTVRGPFSGSSYYASEAGLLSSFGSSNHHKHQHYSHSLSQDSLIAIPHRTLKRQRLVKVGDGEDYEDLEGQRRVQAPGEAKRLPGACSNCKRLKMKCVFGPNQNVCRRCQNTNKTCVVEQRKPRHGLNKHESLLRELAYKDRLIDLLLGQIPNQEMPSLPNPRAGMSAATKIKAGGAKGASMGSATHFSVEPNANLRSNEIIVKPQRPPEIWTNGIIKRAEVDALFNIFFEQLNTFVAILDPNMHTAAFVFDRCPFLFTAVCAISSRYYRKRPELYSIAMNFAKQSAATALIDGEKSVELVQAYILMSVYPIPARRWEEDRSLLYSEVAIRMATDLGLHLPWNGRGTSEAHEREILNRARTWLVCFNLDRSEATQIGQQPTIHEHHVVRRSRDWYRLSEFNLSTDIHLTAYTRLSHIVTRFLTNVYSDPNSPTGLNKSLDFMRETAVLDEELIACEKDMQEQFEGESDHNSRLGLRIPLSLVAFVVFSLGYQQVFQRGLQHGKVLFDKCYEAASEVVRITTEVLAPSGRLMYAPDGHFVSISFAAAFLLKMLRPQFAANLEPAQYNWIMQIVPRLGRVLASDEVATDDEHSPRLYSRFLNDLLFKQSQYGMVLTKPLNQSGLEGDAGAAGSSGSADYKPMSGIGSFKGKNTSANTTEVAMKHESPDTTPLELGPKVEEGRGEVSATSGLRHMMVAPVIPPPKIDQGTQNIKQTGQPTVSQHGLRQEMTSLDQKNKPDHVAVEPSGKMASTESTSHDAKKTSTDTTRAEVEHEKIGMLDAMYALLDPSWFDNFLMPGINANFRDDEGSRSSGIRQWYNMNPGAIPICL
ncbi:Tyrosine kinase domain protein [Ceratobasidium sp. AG-Ba]|nr:Tyrosine kinase domain protein [Ceratobasidium sp. AG-Ba]